MKNKSDIARNRGEMNVQRNERQYISRNQPDMPAFHRMIIKYPRLLDGTGFEGYEGEGEEEERSLARNEKAALRSSRWTEMDAWPAAPTAPMGSVKPKKKKAQSQKKKQTQRERRRKTAPACKQHSNLSARMNAYQLMIT